jgi:electron transfer flavoprotein alpha subunit
MTVLVLVELDATGTSAGPAASDASLRALTLARSLGAAPGGAPGGLSAVVFADSSAIPAATLAEYGAETVYVVEPSALDGYAPVAWARVLAGLAAETGATAVLAAGTDRGNEVLAHLGAITGLPMAANCTAASPETGGGPSVDRPSVDRPSAVRPGADQHSVDRPSAVRPGVVRHRVVRHRWAGLLLEDAVLDAPVALLTVATDGVPAVPAPVSANPPVSDPPVHVHKPELADGDLVVRAVESAADAGGVSLATARVVVGGGRGVGGPDGFAPLEELAGLLGGVVGVSRVVTSEGWRPHRQQVGQTGTKITPELYLACGISGAIQHIAGCAGAKHIIAINTDPGAPILSHADYAVIGDLHQIVPALIQALRSR